MSRPPSRQPTDGELEILRVLWEIGPAPLGQVHSTIQSDRPVALTTVATMLKLMLGKELVSRESTPKGYAWSAELGREAAASGLIGKVVRHVFDGPARRLVAHMIREGGLDAAERAELAGLLADAGSGASH